MNLKTAKIRILDLDLKGCVYLNHFSHSHAVANFLSGSVDWEMASFGTRCWL
jgi:hypothetical protein